MADLIDREALKKLLKSNCDLCKDKNTSWCEHCCPLNDFEDLIDSTSAVNPCKNCDLYFKAVTYKAMREAEKNETNN